MANILIVEDDRDLRNMFKDMLETQGHTISLAEHGVEGLHQLKANPDLVLLDISMPLASGDVVLGFIRSTPELAATKVLIVSAYPDARIIADQLGADACLDKPVDFENLLSTVRRLLDTSA